MNRKRADLVVVFFILSITLSCAGLTGGEDAACRCLEREYNGWYQGPQLNRIAFPLGGMGAGMVCLEGTGAFSHVSVRNEMEVFNEPCQFAALCVKGKDGNTARVLEGQVPGWKIFGKPSTGNGAPGTSYGFPRFDEARFLARFPFAAVELTDRDIPLQVDITGWSPFVPGASDDSSLPVAAVEYTFENSTGESVEAVFSFNSKNFMAIGGGGDSVKPIKGGFVLSQAGSEENPEREGSFAFFVDSDNVVVDHCWFKGGWWDSLTLAWENIEAARLLDNPPAKGRSPGASLFVPFSVEPGGKETIRLLMSWHVPRSSLRYGRDAHCDSGPAFGHGPSKGGTPSQQEVTGFLGKGLINTFDPCGDVLTGSLTLPPFEVTAGYISFLLGGGNHPGKTCIELLSGDSVVRTATGKEKELLEWNSWDVREFRGRKMTLRIKDEETAAWGHINVDQIVMADKPMTSGDLPEGAVVIDDFEDAGFDGWIAEGPPPCPDCTAGKEEKTPTHHIPWYAGRFAGIAQVAEHWRGACSSLREKSAVFRDAFYDTTLPPEVVEAVASNLTILKSPTVLRQEDGKLWCWEGCCDSTGCCAGSCTHVWNYAQAICHLFPDMERSLRQTEFHESQNKEGHQAFRSALPIRPVAHTYHAASDGQLGGIMKVHRDWRILGDIEWLRSIWPEVKQSLDYCIATWDPRHNGVLEEPHHNTYDIEYWGPDGHCSSFYLGALEAAARMGTALGDDVTLYESLLEKGKGYLETELWGGEYFIQKIRTEGLNAKFTPLDSSHNSQGYREIVAALNEQGPKYQYGEGCLSDGVLGFWIARMCGLGQLVDATKVKSSLNAIHKYNFKADLSDHANPQRPTYACGHEGGLLLCTWPHGCKLSLPFVYSNEVWTGIEYQVASHLMIEGMTEKGLDVVRACRDRYDGTIRNPFNEYECGHWYARAMSSYGLIQGMTGVRYDAVEKALSIDSRVGDSFRSFLSTATGFGVVGLENGEPFIDVRMGEIEVKKLIVIKE